MTQEIGGKKRRCDSRCHYSRGKRCRCICGGRFHGKALKDNQLEREVEKAVLEHFKASGLDLELCEKILGGRLDQIQMNFDDDTKNGIKTAI